MASHYTIPSFAARNQNKADTYTLKYNPDKQNYSLTLTDTNNTLANLSLSASGIKVSRSGNQYTFTSDKMITSPITVSAQKAVNLDCDEMLIWGCVGKQTMVSGASDPVYFYFKLDTETYGTGLIKKDLGGRCCIWHQIQYFWQRRKSNRRDQSRRHGRYFFDAGGLHRHRTAD